MHQLTVLRSIPSEYIEIFQKLIKTYIWDDKKARIPLHILQGSKEDGGLGLINIKIKDQTCKLKWVVKLLNDKNLREFAYTMLQNKLGDLI